MENKRPVCPREIAIEAAESGGHETSLIPGGRGSSKEDSGIRSLGPTTPSELKPSDRGH